jgi:AraC-like DNA-binding protein
MDGYDTASVRPEERFDYLRLALSRPPVPLEILSEPSEIIEGCSASAMFGPFVVTHVTSMWSAPLRQARTLTQIRRYDPEAVRFLMLIGGALALRQGTGRRHEFRSGDVGFFHTSRSFESWRGGSLTPTRMIMFTFDHRVLSRRPGRPESLVGTILQPAPEALSLARVILPALASNLGTFVLEHSRIVEDSLRVLSESLVAKELGGKRPQLEQASQLFFAKVYLEQHMRESTLSPGQVAQALGICPTTLFKLFRDAGDKAPMEMVAELRLKAAKKALDDPSFNGTIGGLAQSLGYRNHETFTRAFGDAYGRPPSKREPRTR